MIDDLIEITKQAGRIIMSYYNKNKIEVMLKEDNSPVSVADLESNNYICDSLKKLFPNIPIVSEEGDKNVNISSKFWSVDPLDGTKSFISKSGFFTINIALVEDGLPTIGIVYSPLNDVMFFTEQKKVAKKLEKNNDIRIIKTRKIPEKGVVVLISSSSADKEKIANYLNKIKVDKIIPVSSALKICSIAEGSADIYPRFGKTMEWDTAAGHAILKAAGGNIINLKGEELTYGNFSNDFVNPDFIAKGF